MTHHSQRISRLCPEPIAIPNPKEVRRIPGRLDLLLFRRSLQLRDEGTKRKRKVKSDGGNDAMSIVFM